MNIIFRLLNIGLLFYTPDVLWFTLILTILMLLSILNDFIVLFITFVGCLK